MKKELNQGMKEWQNKVRQDTTDKIERAISILKNEGYQEKQINYKRLVEKTGFSRSLFGKPHVVEILKKHGVAGSILKKQIDNRQLFERELRNVQAALQISQKKLEKSEEAKQNLRELLKEKELELQLLRGELQKLYSRVKCNSINLD